MIGRRRFPQPRRRGGGPGCTAGSRIPRRAVREARRASRDRQRRRDREHHEPAERLAPWAASTPARQCAVRPVVRAQPRGDVRRAGRVGRDGEGARRIARRVACRALFQRATAQEHAPRHVQPHLAREAAGSGRLDENAEDVQATLVALTARTIGDAVRGYAPGAQQILVCGGGANNATLMRDLATRARAAQGDDNGRRGRCRSNKSRRWRLRGSHARRWQGGPATSRRSPAQRVRGFLGRSTRGDVGAVGTGRGDSAHPDLSMRGSGRGDTAFPRSLDDEAAGAARHRASRSLDERQRARRDTAPESANACLRVPARPLDRQPTGSLAAPPVTACAPTCARHAAPAALGTRC